MRQGNGSLKGTFLSENQPSEGGCSPAPLVKDQAVADAWDIEFGHYTTVSRFLDDLSAQAINQIQAELEAIMQLICTVRFTRCCASRSI